MKIFYVIYIRDDILGSYLNAIRYLSNPLEKHDAHITVRGPYSRSINVENFNKIIKNEKVTIKSVGTFFEAKQNTVFLECEAEKLIKIWQKSDYGFHPHITLYDGKSRVFAKQLLKILNSHLINFSFTADKLSKLRSIKGQIDYKLSLEANLKYIGSIVKRSLSHDEVEDMADDERLELIDKITEHLSFIKSKKKLSITLGDNEKIEAGNYDLTVMKDNVEDSFSASLEAEQKIFVSILRDS